ncbi:lysophospholipid acyltransferase family protein [Marinoscillum furvescens]|uniref:KDO2-lipid IV(A) lauroyltransferase n=1 Tax=Marinoscillum furvescens DSM 4134 TaxID=1122208 RepID=A0A3D9LI22_MARFU|nr:lysophospholipid acyltransferase family protein [Marinoscillum furvescens]REE05679.1 KDO2-lipid IV(A) lauroyltransferase [Marinoscillum furvescens DSM 4134]
MAALLYFLVLKPLSLLPLRVIYLLSDLLYCLQFVGLAYRKKVVTCNLHKAFADRSPAWRRKVRRQFYRHFYDLLAESISLFSISQKEAIRRFRVVNPELLEELAEAKKSVVLVGGHYQNWELYAVASNPQIPHQLTGIYTPLTNPFFEKKFSGSRSRFGLKLIPKKQVKDFFESSSGLTCTTFAVDQCPRKGQKVYWTTFLGQPTAVHFGAEKYARTYDQAVVFGAAKKIKRGHYELHLELMEPNPRETEAGAITQRHTARLEQQILEAPEYWLWTHKRWKLQP